MATEYVLLLQDHDDPTRFTLRDVVEVEHGPTQAVRLHAEEREGATGSSPEDGDRDAYIAVPVRNWSVVTRSVTVPAPRVATDEVDSREFLSAALAQPRIVNALDSLESPPVPYPEAEALAAAIEEVEA